MLNIEILAIGKLSQSFLREGAAEYEKRIRPFYGISVRELPEAKLRGEHASDEMRVIVSEGEQILKALEKRRGRVVALAVEGDAMSSEGLASYLADTAERASGVTFVVGGSLGLSDAVKKRADTLLSLSAMTLPHQLARLVLLEQIYRAAAINANVKYHK